ncbi:Uncharacterised protein [Achromobacter sp. 2789STDY5608628]|nr:Uncharacterised protein [Achromobacter sp. 2789STDY5608628]
MASAVTAMLLSMKARLTPTAMASMLVAKPVAASSQNEWRPTGAASSWSAPRPLRIIIAPRIQSMPKAIQWSQSCTKRAAMEPSAQPITGVMASITPKITPVRSASDSRGLCRAAPLPTAAAKASVDMAKARMRVERAFMRERLRPGETHRLSISPGQKLWKSPWSRQTVSVAGAMARRAKSVDAGASGRGRKRLLPREACSVAKGAGRRGEIFRFRSAGRRWARPARA